MQQRHRGPGILTFSCCGVWVRSLSLSLSVCLAGSLVGYVGWRPGGGRLYCLVYGRRYQIRWKKAGTLEVDFISEILSPATWKHLIGRFFLANPPSTPGDEADQAQI